MNIFLQAKKDVLLTSHTELSSPLNLVAEPGIIAFTGSASLQKNVYLSAIPKTIKFFGIVSNAIQSQKVSEVLQKLVVEGLITLFTIDLSHVGMGVQRFTDTLDENKQPISYGGHQYFPLPVSVEGFERNSQGSQARPIITLSATSVEITSLLISGQGLQGARVTRVRTLKRFLDTGEEPDGTVYIDRCNYIIDRIAEWQAGVYVKVELRNALDLENVGIPNLKISKYYCNKVYRLYNATDDVFQIGQYNPCPYADDTYYNFENELVENPHQDICGKTIKSCEVRFGRGNILPFGGFPGTSPQGR